MSAAVVAEPPKELTPYDIEMKKRRANVRVFEKINISDRRQYGTLNPLGAAMYGHMPAADAAKLLQDRIDEGKKKYGGFGDKGWEDAELLWHNIRQGQTNPVNGIAGTDGWIYAEAYYKSPTLNATYNAVIDANGSVHAY